MVVGFHLQVTQILFWTGGVGVSDFLWPVSDFFMQSSVSCLKMGVKGKGKDSTVNKTE